MTASDWRGLPGDPSREGELFSCPDEHTQERAFRAPKCSVCGKKMKLIRDDPYADRRRKIREERDQE